MILICNHIKDFSIYSKTNSKRVVEPVAINIQNIVYLTPMNLWKDGDETIQITRVVLNRAHLETHEDILYLEHNFEELRGMLFGMTLVHDYRVEHGTHYLQSFEFTLPKDDSEDDDISF